MRRAARTDRNQPEIVAALRKAGAAVTDTSAVGQGFPDLVATYRGRVYLLEVKDGQKPPSERKLTPEQERWHKAQHAAIHVVKTVDEALASIGAMTPALERHVLDTYS